MALSTFPFLAPAEFNSACQDLVDRCTSAQTPGGWSIRSVTQTCPSLRITRYMDVLTDPIHLDRHEAYMTQEDEDPVGNAHSPLPIYPIPMLAPCKGNHMTSAQIVTFLMFCFLTRNNIQEELIRSNLKPQLQVDYDIVLSPTYQVPVLYFALRWLHQNGPIGLDAVYQYLVPEQYQTQVKSVGVMGGISLGYHPDSGTPAFFVHPCNTADAMAQVGDAQSITPGTYLLIWLGLVGHCVNLHIPRELVASGPALSNDPLEEEKNIEK
ncbi:Autophagy-related protein 3 [Penicillium herquei]|nr:Autophagy-related protein 3 [Penicillium herquei]